MAQQASWTSASLCYLPSLCKFHGGSTAGLGGTLRVERLCSRRGNNLTVRKLADEETKCTIPFTHEKECSFDMDEPQKHYAKVKTNKPTGNATYCMSPFI